MSEAEMVMAESAEILPKVTEQQLDEQVREIHELQAQGASVMWQLGRKLSEIKTQQTWKMRDTSAIGLDRYTSFEQFCKHELKMHKATIYKLIDVSRTFPESDVTKFGTTKLALMLQVSTETRDALKQRAEEGASSREIEKLVREEKKTTGYQKPSSGKAVPHNAGRTKTKPLATTLPELKLPDPDKRIRTVATKQKVTVKLTGKNNKPATKGNLPWTGELQLENHAKQTFTINSEPRCNPKFLVLTITTKRDE